MISIAMIMIVIKSSLTLYVVLTHGWWSGIVGWGDLQKGQDEQLQDDHEDDNDPLG